MKPKALIGETSHSTIPQCQKFLPNLSNDFIPLLEIHIVAIYCHKMIGRTWKEENEDTILGVQYASLPNSGSKDRGMEIIVSFNLWNIQTILNNIQNVTIDYSILWLSNFCNFKVLSHIDQQIQPIIGCSAFLKKR